MLTEMVLTILIDTIMSLVNPVFVAFRSVAGVGDAFIPFPTALMFYAERLIVYGNVLMPPALIWWLWRQIKA